MRIVAVDIETTNLSALMGRILCCSFYPITLRPGDKPADVKTLRIDRKPYRRKNILDDSELAGAIADEISKYNCIVTWNGKLFDIPFVNARLALVEGAPCNPQMHLDLMYYAGGNSTRIGSKKLVNVQKFFKLAEEKTDLEWETWQKAAAGDKKSMEYVVDHCEQDVKVLAEVYWKLISQVRNIHR